MSHEMNEPKAGQRIRLITQMVNEPSSTIPVEFGMRAGIEGTIVATSFAGPKHLHMIYVRWDNGRSLSVLPYVDEFEVFDEPAACSKEGGE